MKEPCRIWLRQAPSVIDRNDFDLLDESERSTNRRFATESLRARHASAHALLRHALGQAVKCDPVELRFEHGKNGRPRLAGFHGQVDFNLSHSGPYVACAVVESGRVGIDVETGNSRVNYREILDRVASPVERSWIENKPPREARRAFFRLWVLKEAYAKARGDGLNLPFADITLMPGQDGFVLDLAATGDSPDHWQFALYGVNEDAAMSVAMHTPEAGDTGNSIEVMEGSELLN